MKAYDFLVLLGLIVIVAGTVIAPSHAYAVSFRDHTGYIPSWAEPIGESQALAVCSSVEYNTQDWNWCQEFSGYVVDNLNKGSQESDLAQKTEKPQPVKGKIFESHSGIISTNAYRNELYGFSIIPPKGWIAQENIELLGNQGAGLVGFYSNQNNPIYTANFLVNYVEVGESAVKLFHQFGDQEVLNSVVQGISGGGDSVSSQTKIINKKIESFDDGYKAQIEYVQILKLDNHFVPVHRESVGYILNNGNAYWLNFVSTQEDFDKNIGEFRKAAETFYVGPEQTLSALTGMYSDSNTGFQIVIPDGWFGYKLSSGSIAILPFNEKLTPNLELAIVINVQDKSSLKATLQKATPSEESVEGKDNNCKDSVTYFLLNEIPTREQNIECNDKRVKSYTVAAKGQKIITIAYLAHLPFNKNKIDDFEKLASTLHVDSPESIKDLYREAAGYIASDQSITIDNYPTKLRFYSYSPISDFTFDEKNTRISFKVDESTDNGSTIMSISRIMEGPYAVEMDGKTVSYDVTEDRVEKITEISVDYKQGTHEISVIGNKLVSQNVQPPIHEKTLTEQKSEKKVSGCLIATATFGSEMAPQVQQLRELRDNALLKTSSGSAFMTSFNLIYYTFSPTVADWERQNPVFKEAVKVTITPLITTLSILNYVPIHSEGEMLFYGLGIILLNIGIYFVTPAFAIIKLKKTK